VFTWQEKISQNLASHPNYQNYEHHGCTPSMGVLFYSWYTLNQRMHTQHGVAVLHYLTLYD